MASALNLNMDAFQQELEMLMARGEEGKFALVHSGKLRGAYGTYKDAIEAAYDRFDTEPFLVRRIEPFRERVALHFAA